MTLIASYQNNDYLFMVGDLFLSRHKNPEGASLPTRFRKDQEPVPNYFVGLTQKLVIINTNLLVAWAGSAVVARSIINEISESLSPPYSSDSIFGLIEELGLTDDELNSVSFIFWGVSVDKNRNRVDQFVNDYKADETILGERIKFKHAGSGVFHFLECLDFEQIKSIGDSSDFERFLSWGIAKTAYALYQEIISDELHNCYYGGGFEFACLNAAGEIEKIPISFCFWKVSVDRLDLVGPIFSHNYDSDGTLVISRFDCDPENMSDWTLKNFIVPSILSGKVDIDIKVIPDLDPHFTVHYFVKDGANTKAMIKNGQHKNVRMKCYSDGRVEIDFDKAFIDEVKRLFR